MVLLLVNLNKILSLILNCIFINIAQGGVLPNIRSELLPKKHKSEEENAGSIESQRGAQGHQMAMVQSGGSMANSGMKKKSIPPAKKSLAPPTSQKKSNKPKPMQQQKAPPPQQQLKKDNDDDDDEEEDEDDDDSEDEVSR